MRVSIRENKSLFFMLWFALVGLFVVFVLAIIYVANAHSKPQLAGFKDATEYPGGSDVLAPQMRLENGRTGTTFDTASLSGEPYVVTFLYTHCPTICPLIGAELQEALRELGPEAKRVAVVGLSVDPIGDTVSTVKAWLHVHQEPSNFQYLIGSKEQLQPYWNAWHVGPQIVGDPDSSHTAAIYLITSTGRIAGIISAGTQVPSSDLAYDFRALLKS